MDKRRKRAPRLRRESVSLNGRLAEAEATLEAIQTGAADAIVVQTERGVEVFTIQGAETAYRIMVENMNEGAVTVDSGGIILYVNNAICSLLGTECSAMVGKPLRDWIVESRRTFFEAFCEKASAAGGGHGDFELIRRDAPPLPVYLSIAPLEVAGRHDLCLVISDLTERRIAERTLMELNESLDRKVRQRTWELENLTASLEEEVESQTAKVKMLARELSLAEQRERQRLSMVLHEDLQQTLFALKARFNLLIETLGADAPEEAREDAAQLARLTSQALDTTRWLAVEFNPPVLKNEGLDAALKWLTHHFAERYGGSVDLDIQEDFKGIPQDERVLIVNLTRELLLNVVKHAGIKTASVRVRRSDDSIVIETRDMGAGFDQEKERGAARGKNHMGLFSIEERLRLFGGEMTIDSMPGIGTTVVMTLPVSPADGSPTKEQS
jgi:PAS domain S-box-containing protein